MKLNEAIKQVVHNRVLKEDVNDAQKAVDLFQEFDAQDAEDFFEKLADFYHARASTARAAAWPEKTYAPSASAETFGKLAELCDKASQLLSNRKGN